MYNIILMYKYANLPFKKSIFGRAELFLIEKNILRSLINKNDGNQLKKKKGRKMYLVLLCVENFMIN